MTPPFRRVLIANRGEIALRVIRACRDLAMESVAVYSDADAVAPECPGRGSRGPHRSRPAAESYLRMDRVPRRGDAHRRRRGPPRLRLPVGARRVRPCRDRVRADLRRSLWQPIAGLGDKLAARAGRGGGGAGRPRNPSSPRRWTGQIRSTRSSTRGAHRFPVDGQGGGRGWGTGDAPGRAAEELPAALMSGSAEAASAFGDGAVYLEREIRPARHVEVQLLGEVDGRMIALGERDCSIQRRHQKLIEESPAPGLDEDQRRDLHETAVRAARPPVSSTPPPSSSCWTPTGSSGSSR